MIMLFSSLYSKLLGCDKYKIELEKSIKLAELLQLLEDKFPQLKYDSKETIEGRYASHYLCISDGRILHLDDRLEADATVELIPPIMGG